MCHHCLVVARIKSNHKTRLDLFGFFVIMKCLKNKDMRKNCMACTWMADIPKDFSNIIREP